jgi:hypothetical protein
MKTRPWSFWLVASLCWLIAASFPLQIAWLYGHSPLEWPQILAKLSLLNGFCMLALLSVGCLALNGSRLLYVAIPVCCAMVTYNNFVVGVWGYDYSPVLTYTSSVAFAAFCGFIFLPSFSLALQKPELRWWLVAPRRNIHVPVLISLHRGSSFSSRTIDVSLSGARVELAQNAEIHIGDLLNLHLKINTLQNLNLKGAVVRKQDDSQQVGIHFEHLEPTQKKILERFLRSH